MAINWAVRLCAVGLWLLVAIPAWANNGSLFPGGSGGLIVTGGASATGHGSLFVGRQESGLFAPRPEPQAEPEVQQVATPRRGAQGQIGELLSLIALAEAGPADYDAVQHGARIRPGAPPTQMTLGQIYEWIDATPGQPHAIGRYHFIPDTLRRVARIRGYGPQTPFSPEVQDSLALVLLEDAGLSDFQAGRLGRRTFMRNLARIWAGLPLPNGRSYYHGYAGNKATMTWSRFESGMARIWPVDTSGP